MLCKYYSITVNVFRLFVAMQQALQLINYVVIIVKYLIKKNNESSNHCNTKIKYITQSSNFLKLWTRYSFFVIWFFNVYKAYFYATLAVACCT